MNASNGHVPAELRLARDRRSLTVSWADGSRSTLPAALLRSQGRSADALRAHIDGLGQPVPDDLSITSVTPVGAYAVNIVFSDGYRRGIYPWAHLARIADGLQLEQPVGAPGA